MRKLAWWSSPYAGHIAWKCCASAKTWQKLLLPWMPSTRSPWSSMRWKSSHELSKPYQHRLKALMETVFLHHSITYGSAIRLPLDWWIGTGLPVQQNHEAVQFKGAVEHPNFELWIWLSFLTLWAMFLVLKTFVWQARPPTLISFGLAQDFWNSGSANDIVFFLCGRRACPLPLVLDWISVFERFGPGVVFFFLLCGRCSFPPS